MISGTADKIVLGRGNLLLPQPRNVEAETAALQSLQQTIFNEVLSSALLRSSTAAALEETGLTIADYLANPAPALSPIPAGHHHASKFAPSKRSEHLAADQPACLPDADVAATCSSEHEPAFPESQHEENGFPQSPSTRSVQNRIEQCISKAAADYDLPPTLIRGVIKAESDFQVTAVSPAGAKGLMQLMPGTVQDLGVKNPFDIEQNIDGGARYLRKMLDMFDGNVALALAAYNAGPGKVIQYRGIPPYQETQHYVRRVLNFQC